MTLPRSPGQKGRAGKGIQVSWSPAVPVWFHTDPPWLPFAAIAQVLQRLTITQMISKFTWNIRETKQEHTLQKGLWSTMLQLCKSAVCYKKDKDVKTINKYIYHPCHISAEMYTGSVRSAGGIKLLNDCICCKAACRCSLRGHQCVSKEKRGGCKATWPIGC